MRQRLLGAALLVAASATAYAQPAPDAGTPSTPDPAATEPAPAPADPHDADLAAAADATAEAAALTPPGDTSAADASADDIDLAALGLDPASAEASFDDKLSIYGFADFNLNFSHMQGTTSKAFSSGKLNVYLSKNLTQKFRALAEVRLMYLPNGASGLMGGTPTLSLASDPTGTGGTVEVGGISIQRVYAEYDLNRFLTIRAGHWLTPYGVWNVDHGSPAIIPVSAPYIIGQRLIPESQTGLQAFGSAVIGDYRIGYYATVSNGRSHVESTQDPDGRVALGGRLELEAPFFGTLKLGVSGYGGRSTVLSETAPSWAYNERDFGADAQWDHGPLHLQGEYLLHRRSQIDETAPPIVVPSGMSADTDKGTAHGAYALAAYRTTHLWNVTPFGYYEYYRPVDGSMRIHGVHVGLNFRPIPSLVLKVQGITADTGANSELLDFWMLNTQAAWVF